MKQKFFPEDVGKPVTKLSIAKGARKGKITEYFEKEKYSVRVVFEDDGERFRPDSECFSPDGRLWSMDEEVSLFHGHNIKVTIEGEEIPKRKKKMWLNIFMDNEDTSVEICGYLYPTERQAKEGVAKTFKYILIAHEVEVDA